MKFQSVFSAAALSSIALAAAVAAPDDNGHAPHGKRITLTYENITAGQTFSPSVWFSHNASAPPLFMEGKPAAFGLMRIAEEGNAGPLLSAQIVKDIGGAYGAVTQGVSILPGKSRTVEIDVDAAHPLISGAFMLVMTNDGFTGLNGVNAFNLTRPMTMDLYAYDAGTEKNNERGDYLIAMEGTGRDPENGVVRRHTGIRGDADAPGSWKFDPQRPVARITFTPAAATN
jgi:hypothetical protein